MASEDFHAGGYDSGQARLLDFLARNHETEPGPSFIDGRQSLPRTRILYGIAILLASARESNKHRWRLCDAKGRVLAESAVGYTRRAAAIAAVKQAQAATGGGRIE
jgi:uncharacterized protein YegP (UPF0339 family)